MHLILDFETRSALDLKKVGLYRYTADSSTEVMCYAWKLAGSSFFSPKDDAELAFSPDDAPKHLLDALADDTIDIHAHNAVVERKVIEDICGPRHGWPVPRRSRFRCSASRVGRLALPRSLEKAALALRVAVQKDVEGGKIMKRLCKPIGRDPDKGWIYDNDPEKLRRLGEYCKTDVLAEEAIENATFDLTPMEENYFLLVQRINDRGVRVDTSLVRDLLWQALAAGSELDAEICELTDGAVERVTNVGALKDWIYQESGISLATLRKEDMENLDGEQFSEYPKVSRAIELRQLGGKSSIAKLRTILDRVCADGLLRGAFVANATSTGRLTSIGVQLQNLPRETLKDYDNRIADISTLTVVDISKAIRGVFVPFDKEHIFVDADYAAVEARGVAWLAGADALVQQFLDGRDPYCEIGWEIYGRLITKLDEVERFVGKQTILGCGYGMGWAKFEAQCIKFGIPVGSLIAQKAVTAYREGFPEIPLLWKGLERAAIQAVRHPGTVTEYGPIRFKVASGYLQMRLPSGRKLYYKSPRLRSKPTPWGGESTELTYMATHSVTKLWVVESTWGGKLAENAVQAICADLLFNAKLRIERRGLPIVLSVHDQVVVDVPRSRAQEAMAIVKEEMERGEDWAVGFPIKAEPKLMERFGK